MGGYIRHHVGDCSRGFRGGFGGFPTVGIKTRLLRWMDRIVILGREGAHVRGLVRILEFSN